MPSRSVKVRSADAGNEGLDPVDLAQVFLAAPSFPDGREAKFSRADVNLPVFPALFPAWRILLALLVADAQGRKVATSDIALLVELPATTGLRHLTALADQGLVERVPDSHDKRRIWLEITRKGRDVACEALAEFGQRLGAVL